MRLPMSEELRKPVYSIDTNVLMDWQARYFPTDIFQSLGGRVDVLIGEGRWLAPKLVEEELIAVGTAELAAWAKARPQMFVALLTQKFRSKAQLLRRQFLHDFLRAPTYHHDFDFAVDALASRAAHETHAT